MVIFLLPHCCLLLHYVTRVKLQKTIACLILVMNDAHLMCWILFIVIFGVPPPLNQLRDLFVVLFIDDYSRFTWLYPLKLKSEFYDVFIHFTHHNNVW